MLYLSLVIEFCVSEILVFGVVGCELDKGTGPACDCSWIYGMLHLVTDLRLWHQEHIDISDQLLKFC